MPAWRLQACPAGIGRARQRAAVVRRLQQTQARDRVRQLVEVLHQPLNAGVDQPCPVRCASASPSQSCGEDQAGDVVEQAGAAQAVEGLARVLAVGAGLHDAVEQLQEDEFLAGADHVGAVGAALVPKSKKSHGS